MKRGTPRISSLVNGHAKGGPIDVVEARLNLWRKYPDLKDYVAAGELILADLKAHAQVAQ